MVCLPCIFLPALLAIFQKLIKPSISRFLPERWVNVPDPVLYPTCPAKPPPASTHWVTLALQWDDQKCCSRRLGEPTVNETTDVAK
ncbi:unnamed protein product [Heligmosomoides polygyrus]|uniref:Secreted protein n=1 Tax=Heligmosomoides polygyrus TaxID=6339 RepID=A0A183FU32_HELPZ|nr:unnamed protein product [Heligmosomoides polygyrus]